VNETVDLLAQHMVGLLKNLEPEDLPRAVLQALNAYEVARCSDPALNAELRCGLAKGLESWWASKVVVSAVGDAVGRIAEAKANPMGYRDQVRDESLAFLERQHIEMPGHAVVLLISLFSDYRTGDMWHDKILTGGLGLAFDAWTQRDGLMRQAMAQATVKA
jgi:hypothetical protein